jgi:hypothetical protein
MGTILSESEAEDKIFLLPKSEQAEIERDKIRFGEFFIQLVNNNYSRINPINVVVKNGVPELIINSASTVI